MSAVDGKLGEHAFAYRALERGLSVSWPTSSHLQWDLIVSSDKKDYRVQIKANGRKGHRYQIGVQHEGKKYDSSRVQYVVIWIRERDLWYIIPTHLVQLKTIRIYPDLETCRWDRFKENWHVFK